MGLKGIEALRRFNEELSSDQPSPGGGTASAAAGAMAASLLIMVCKITARSKKHEKDRPRLEILEKELEKLRDELTGLAEQDAAAYDGVVSAVRRLKEAGTPEARSAHQTALKHAADVPMKTAAACLEVLRRALPVSRLGVKSASSDTRVAFLLAHAGFEGAAANVMINLGDITDEGYVSEASRRLSSLGSLVKTIAADSGASTASR